MSINFFAIATFAVLLCRLGFEGLIIKNIKFEHVDTSELILKVFTVKSILACTLMPLVCLYYDLIFGDLGLSLVVLLLIPLFFAEIINTSQITVIYHNTIWVLAINLIKITIIFIGLWLATVYQSILYFMYLFSISHMVISIIHLLLNQRIISFIPKFNLKDVWATFYSSFYLFTVKMFTILSDKIILVLCLPYLTDYNAILLDISIRFLGVATVPSLLLYNFMRSRDIFVKKYHVLWV